jgi:hypothetical protein
LALTTLFHTPLNFRYTFTIPHLIHQSPPANLKNKNKTHNTHATNDRLVLQTTYFSRFTAKINREKTIFFSFSATRSKNREGEIGAFR